MSSLFKMSGRSRCGRAARRAEGSRRHDELRWSRIMQGLEKATSYQYLACDSGRRRQRLEARGRL